MSCNINIFTQLLNNDCADANFHTILMSIKVLTALYFIFLACYVRYTTYIKANPKKFVIESAIVGISSVLPFIYMLIYRKSDLDISHKIMLILGMYILFYIINILFEISGFYAFFYRDKKLPPANNSILGTDEKFVKGVKLGSFIVVGLLYAIPMMLLFKYAYHIKDTDIPAHGALTKPLFILEAIIFGICNTVSLYYIAHNRGHRDLKENTKEIFLMTCKMIILHLLLQFSGFYKHAFHKSTISH